jgi:hypothetical protein
MECGEWPVRVWPEEECMQRVSLRLGEEFGSAFPCRRIIDVLAYAVTNGRYSQVDDQGGATGESIALPVAPHLNSLSQRYQHLRDALTVRADPHCTAQLLHFKVVIWTEADLAREIGHFREGVLELLFQL